MNQFDQPTQLETAARLPLPSLSRDDAVELANYLSALARAELPMAAGARAMASDLPPGQLPRALGALADALESGESLEVALNSLGRGLPLHVRELVIAGARSGNLADTLDALLVHEREMNDLGQQLWHAISYPCVLLGFVLAWLLFIAMWLVPQMEAGLVLADVEELSGLTPYWNSVNEPAPSPYASRLRDFARIAPPLLLLAGGGLVVMVAAARYCGGRPLVSRTIGLAPLVGPAWRYRWLAEFSGLLSLFLKQELPLAESLRLTAAATRDGALRDVAAHAAEQVAAGESLSRCLARRSGFPQTVINLVAWGERKTALPEALSSARRMMIERFELQVRLIRLVVPPIVFLLATGSALFVAYGWMAALSHAIRMLSVW